MNYLLDTNILLGHLKGEGFTDYLDKTYHIFSGTNLAGVSVVTIGELKSLAIQRKWGTIRQTKMQSLLEDFLQLPVAKNVLVERYAQIDAYSQGKLLNKPLPSGMSARNMGKNDIWIAATASLVNATLITADKDFDHLSDTFLKVVRIDIQNF